MNSNIKIKRRNKNKLSDLIEVKEFDLEDENLILNYTIMNDDFAKYIYSKYKQGQIKTKYFTPYLQTVFRWIMKYIGEYNRAPKKIIQNIYDQKSKSLSDEKKEVISIFLERLSEEFVKQDEDGIDIEWLKKEIVPKFVLKQEALLKKKNIQLALDHNDNELLEKTLSSVNKITNEDDEFGFDQKGIELCSLNDLDKDFEILKPLWRKHIPACEPVIIEGREGLGKTSLAVMMTLDILRKKKNSLVIWLLCDSSPRDTKNLFKDLWTEKQWKRYRNSKRLVFPKQNGEYVWNFTIKENEDKKNLIDAIKTAIKDYENPLTAVFIDSIRGMTPYEESSDNVGKTMLKSIQPIICQRFKAACVYIHHWNKDEDKRDVNRSSGSTATRSAVRLIFALKETIYDNVKIIQATKPNYNDIPVLESSYDIKEKKIKIDNARKDWDKILLVNEKNKPKTLKEHAIDMLTNKIFSKTTKRFAMDIYKEGEDYNPPLSKYVLLRAADNLNIKKIRDNKKRSIWICKDFK